MNKQNLTGLYGKLPAHGDFIYRDLSTHFINAWDQWLQGYVEGTREQIGDGWLDVYLTSPIWRFAFSEGVIDDKAWAGIFLPSVDRVGRYFPFSIVTCLPPQTNPTEFMCTRKNWYQAMEDAALSALGGTLHIDDLIEELNDSNPMSRSAYHRGTQLSEPSRFIVKLPNAEQPVSAALPYMMDACLSAALKSYSVWSTSGSSMIEPCMFVSQGLPTYSGVAAMMDGHWEHWGWQQPYPLKA